MALTLRTSKGSQLTIAEMDANLTHLADSSNHSFSQSGSGASSRTAQAKLREIVSVTDFGAAGDGGVTDSTTEAQAALTTGYDVFVPKGASYYKLTAALSMQSNQRLYLEAGAELRQTTANECVVDINGKTNAHVYGPGTIYAVGSFSSVNNGCGVRIRESSARCSVKGVTVKNHRGSGVAVFDSNDCLVEGNWFIDSPVSDTDDHTECAADIAIQYASSRNKVRGNWCISGQGVGIQVQSIDASDVTEENEVSGNTIKNARMYGISVYKTNSGDTVRHNSVTGNTIRNITGAVQHSSSGYVFGAGIYNQGAEDTIIHGNNIRGTHTASQTFQETLAPGAIGATNCTRVSIKGNHIEDANMHGITVRDPSAEGASTGFAHISGNTITNVTVTAIEVKERGRVSIKNNEIDTCERAVHINNSSAADELITVKGNTIKTTTSHAIQAAYASQLKIQGNNIKAQAFAGVLVDDCSQVSILGNQVANGSAAVGSRGVVISSTDVTDGCFIDGNTCTDNEYGMILDGENKLGKNNVYGNTVNYNGTHGPVRSFASTDATPSVLNAQVFKTANASATTITGFDDGELGQRITVVIGDANTTVDFTGTSLKGNGGSDWTPTTNDSMECVYDGTNWYCRISDNTA